MRDATIITENIKLRLRVASYEARIAELEAKQARQIGETHPSEARAMGDMETAAVDRADMAQLVLQSDHWVGVDRQLIGALLRDHARALARIAELEADAEKVAADELRKLNLVIDQREAGRVRIRDLEAEVARLTAALATIDEAAVRNGVALQYEAREAERERMLKLGLSFILDQQAREDFIQLARSTL